MKLTLNNGKTLDVLNVEESYYPRNTQGAILNIQMKCNDSIDELRDVFTPEALGTIIVGEGEDAKIIEGYTQIDSIRKLYTGETEYDTTVDLVKEN